jgi:alkanesulfonate monooxygenase SsuD/methylene tetrahydromethanopterin reductase-like flavin-dependent oxidoreductase (luciferase family)
MGQKPPRVAEFGEYLRVVRALLAGEQVDYTQNDHTAPIRFHHHGYPFLHLEQPIPIYVSAFGPKVQALAGQYGDGLIVSFPRVSNLDDAMVNVREGAARAGRSLEGFHTSALATLAVLEPGEAANSERILRECGPSVMASVHFVYERLHHGGGEPPAWIRPIWKQFSALMEHVPPRELHFALHGNHYSYLPPEEARLITAEMVKQVCIVGQPEEIIERIRGLERQGLQHLLFLPPVEHRYRMMEDFARKIIRRL